MEPVRWERLRLVRQEHATFDGRFFERHAACWPLARAAATFAARTEWPEPIEYGTAFEGNGPVRFEPAPVKRKRPRGEPIIRTELYDAKIVQARIVPTRPRMWHDFLNALVWATFPRAKLALHARQHRAIERWLPPGATQLPNARTRELDALALVDEGGVLLLELGDRSVSILFGHALFEGLVLGQRAMVARAVVLDARERAAEADRGAAALLGLADELLAAVLDDVGRIVRPEELPRVAV